MVQIDQERCVGCGRCVADCFPQELEMVEGKAAPRGHRCMECGHCIAVCPVDAIQLPGYDMGEVVELRDMKRELDPETYLNHLKSRRTIRQFTAEPVGEREVNAILQAGRYSPTGSNLQNVTYFVAQQCIPELRKDILAKLRQLGEAEHVPGTVAARYGSMWVAMEKQFQKDGIDHLFFDAGTVIVVSSDSPQSACIAAAHMETMVYSLGLGMLYSGFTTRAISLSPAWKARVCRKEGYEPYAALVIGHPQVTYLRTVPRKPADVVWD